MSDARRPPTNHARLLVAQGDPGAKAVAARALEIFEQTRGAGHPNVAVAADVLGTLAFDEGRLDEAERQFERVKEVSREALGEDHLEVALAIDSLARVALARKDLDRASLLAEDAIARVTAVSPANDAALLDPLLTLAQVHLERGRADDARAVLARAEACELPADPQVAARQLLLRASVPGVDPAVAERLLREGLALARPRSELARRLQACLDSKQ